MLFFSTKAFTQTFSYKNFTVDNGLPSSEVYQVIQDKKGYIWFGTNQGVSRYDGYKFKNFDKLDGLPDNTVLEIYEDYRGRIWFIPLTGKLSYYFDNKIIEYEYNSQIEKHIKKGVHPIKLSFHVDSLENVYISFYASRVLKISLEGKAEFLLPPKNVDKESRLIKILPDGKILYDRESSMGENLCISNKDEIFNIKYPVKYSASLRTIALYDKKDLFFSDGNYIIKINENKIKKIHYFKNRIIWLSKDIEGIIWIGFFNKGVKAYKNNNLDSSHLNLLKNYSISSVCRDKEKGYWFTTLRHGVFYLPSKEIHSLTTKEGLKTVKINTVTAKDNSVWFAGNTKEIYSYDLKNIKKHKLFDEKNYNFRFLKWYGDSLIVSLFHTEYGTYIYRKGEIIDTISDSFYGVRKFENDSNIYLFSRNIFSFYEKEKYLIEQRPDNIYFYDVYRNEKGNFFLATEKGMFLYDKKKKITKRVKDKKGLLSHRIQCIEKGKNNSIWIATKGAGLLYKTKKKLKQFTLKDGLPSNSINSIFVDENILWLSTNRGVAKVRTDSIKKEKIQVETFSISNGLINNEISGLVVNNDFVFAATNKGLSYFNKNLRGINDCPPPIYINKINIMGKDTVLLNKYELRHNQNHIEIDFIGLSYLRVEPLTYEYKLKGIDEEWKTTQSRSVLYPFLPSGEYEFKIRAVNNSGVKSKETKTISFIIKKPYWEEIWFFVLVIFSIIIVIASISSVVLYIKLKEAKKRNFVEKELNKFRQQALSSQMNPHFIYNSLNSVQNYILKNDRKKSSDYLSRFGMLMRRILENSQNSTISLKEEIEALKLYIELELIRFRNNFEFILEIESENILRETSVPPLIIQPYVENAIHHGLRNKIGDKFLKINILSKENHVKIIIEDNGIGREKAEEIKMRKMNTYKSLGTEITAKRINLFKDIFKNKIIVEIIDLYNDKHESTGTRIELKINNA